MKCITCGKDFQKGTFFKCPSCGKEMVARCLKCKQLSVNYKCKCGFEGP